MTDFIVTQKKRLIEITTLLINDIKKLEQIFLHDVPYTFQSEKDFNHVKAETEPIFERLEEWEKLVLDKINKRIISFPITMVDSTVDNISAYIMHSFYKDVRKRRYIEIKQSSLYVLRLLLKELNDEN